MAKLELITEQLAKMSREVKEHQRIIRGINKKIVDLKRELSAILDESELQQIKNRHGTFYFSRRPYPYVIDYEQFANFIYTEKRLDLLSDTPLRTALTGNIPGIEIREKRSLNVINKD
jgi:hypothetical protein